MKAPIAACASLSLVAALASAVYASPQGQARPASSGVVSGPASAPAGAAAAPAAGTAADGKATPAATAAGGEKTAPGAGQAGSTLVKSAPKPPAKPAEKVGFARIDPGWPRWLTLTVVDRMRVDSLPLPGTLGGNYDTYFLNRFRLTAGVRFSSWAQATVQMQDARVREYDVTVPKNLQHSIDVRLAYAELGRKTAKGVMGVVGRQELTFGDGRLMASPDWGNVSRTYDGGRLTAFVPGFKLEVFGAAPVDMNLAFSRGKYGERVAGAWGTFDKVRPLSYVDVYEVVKHNSTAAGETGSKGDQRVYATGLRAGGPIGKAASWETEYVMQRGHSAADRLSGWGLHEGVSWTVGKSAWKPKVGAEYNFASGDSNPKDGVKQTFDQMYASTHAKWGLGDLVGWRNMHQAAVKFEVSPAKRLKVNTAVNRLWLATVTDAWYGASGAKVVTNRAATSTSLGWEPDVFATCTITRDVTVGAGLAVLLGGDFVRQSTQVERIWTPYLMWTLKF